VSIGYFSALERFFQKVGRSNIPALHIVVVDLRVLPWFWIKALLPVIKETFAAQLPEGDMELSIEVLWQCRHPIRVGKEGLPLSFDLRRPAQSCEEAIAGVKKEVAKLDPADPLDAGELRKLVRLKEVLLQVKGTAETAWSDV